MMASTIYSVGIDPTALRPICSTPAIAPEFAGVTGNSITVGREGAHIAIKALVEAEQLFTIQTDSAGFDRLQRVIDEVSI